MIKLGTRRELFVDHFLIDSLSDLQLKLHHPQPANVALAFDQPWEGAFCGYSTVIHDKAAGVYRLYYRGWPRISKEDTDYSSGNYCYAESSDGVTFSRPTLKFREFDGSKANNIFLGPGGPGSHSFSPFLDTNPAADPQQRFKSLGSSKVDGRPALLGWASADGISWKLIREEPLITQGAFDSQNVAFWSDHEGCYVSYYRIFTKRHAWHGWVEGWKETFSPAGGGYRSIARTTSEDFLNWTEPVQIFYGDAPWEQLYTNQTHPYFRAPHLYVALPKRYVQGRQFNSDAQAERLGVVPPYHQDSSDCVFMTTRGGDQYDRTFMEGFIRPGLDAANWASRTNMSSLNVVPTSPTEMSIYCQHRYANPSQYLMRYTLRTDGFASIHAGYNGGEVITKPLTFSGSRLSLNMATSSVGGLRIEVQQPGGGAIDGFTMDDSIETFGDSLDLTPKWQGQRSPGELAGQPVRLRMQIRDADLYSLQFTD